MSNVLLITYMFPPGGGIGTPRALAYAMHLPSQGCRLSVLSPTNPALRDNDPELCKLVPRDIVVHRAWNPELPMSMRDRLWRRTGRLSPGEGKATIAPPGAMGSSFRWLAQHIVFPDPQATWVPLAFRKACRIVEREAIDAVIVNVPPFSILKVGIALKRKFPHLMLICDFRDDWVGYYLKQIDHPSDDKIRRAQKLEAEAVEVSSYVSTVTEQWVNQIRSRYPSQPASKFICTPNGYEPEMFRDFTSRPSTSGKMVVTYFGTVHNNRIYSPENYLDAIETLPDEIRNQIETRFIGRVVRDAEPFLLRRKTIVRRLGFLPKLQGIRYLQESDFALLIATDPGSHAGKLFDYFASGKPVLALSPPGGEIDKLLRRTHTGWCADPWDKKAIQQMIVFAYQRFKQGGAMIHPDKDAVQTFAWPSILANFAVVAGLKTVTSASRVPHTDPTSAAKAPLAQA
jgi:glycosyltransferase involved in cell wall biosynthesis